MSKSIPAFMIHPLEIVRFLLIVLFCVGLFGILYHPHVTIHFFNTHSTHYGPYLFILTSSGYFLLVVSRTLFCFINKRYDFHKKQLHTWLILEAIVIIIFVSLLALALIDANSRPYWTVILPRTAISTTLLLFIPYAAIKLYFTIEEGKEALTTLLGSKGSNIADKRIMFCDDKGTRRFSIEKERLIYIQSADNYIVINYIGKENELKKITLRNTLKNTEAMLNDEGIIRCHRLYIVNLNKVRELQTRKDTHILDMDTDEDLRIPVSKTYAEKIRTLLEDQGTN